jgi:hypothetical protein
MKINSNSAFLSPSIPKSAYIFGWILVFAGLFFAYIYMFSPATFFPDISIVSISEQFGLYSTGVRILGSVLGIFIALYFNSALLLVLMLVTRVFIEIGDVVVGLKIHNGSPDINTVTLTILAAIEIFFVVKLLKHLRG